jgi:uncharacterized protein (TIGR03083 family)
LIGGFGGGLLRHLAKVTPSLYAAPMTIDLGVLYRNARERVAALVSADGIDPTTPVPATPRWDVHGVLAHVSGVATDAATGNMAGAPGDDWTAAHIARAEGKPIAELLDEWAQHAPTLEGFLSGPGADMASAAVVDVHSHEADLRHGLGQPLDIPADFLRWAGANLREGFDTAVAEAGLPPVALNISATEWFRGRLGRRTEAEVRAYPWPVDPDPYLDVFFIFGRATQSLQESSLQESSGQSLGHPS